MLDKIKTGIVFGDVHVPSHDNRAVSILKQVIADTQPEILIDLGDTCDFPSVNHWIQAGSREAEGRRLVKDLKAMYKFSYDIGQAVNNQECKLVKLIGNHEIWIDRFINNLPMLEGLKELDIAKGYQDMGWEIVKHGDFYMVGKLAFHHGDRLGYQGKHHSAQWALLGKSIVYGHRHDVQRFTHETLRRNGKPDRHAAFSIGCLCKFDMKYMQNRKINWNQGFGLFYTNAQGYFQFNHIDIVNGRAIWAGREYKG